VGDDRPIGMFDSGVGGLTVARAVLGALPNESLLYLGDSARSPYGPRPPEEIRRFALEIARFLVARDVKMLVVACNAIEVSALGEISGEAGIPVVGVIDPGVRAAVRATRSGQIGAIGTFATISSGAYDRALARTGARATLTSRACPAFVDFVERGEASSAELLAVARAYLEPLREAKVDALVLGCTHYPLMGGVIGEVMGTDVVLVSSAVETAKEVARGLTERGLERRAAAPPTHTFLSTGDPARFCSLGRVFLGPEIGSVGVAYLGAC